LQRPRDVPVRTSLGAMALAFTIVLFIPGGNYPIVLPPLAYVAAYRIGFGLQRHDRELLEHRVQTGVIKRLRTGAFIEVHKPSDQSTSMPLPPCPRR
jgi:quinol---cytochrome-c reductase cytochrome b subunit